MLILLKKLWFENEVFFILSIILIIINKGIGFTPVRPMGCHSIQLDFREGVLE